MTDALVPWQVETGGIRLHGESVSPSGCRAALLVVHGLGEHGGRYREAMRDLASHGLACFAYDQRGHGLSPGPRVDIRRFGLFVEDAIHAARNVIREASGAPLFMWGHSMGSLVTTLAAGSLSGELSGVVTTGCPIDVVSGSRRWLQPTLGLAAQLAPRLRLSEVFTSRDLSHDAEVQQAYDKDPLVEHAVTLRLIQAIATASRKVCEAAPSLKVPWLAVHGSEDRIAPPHGSQRLVELLGSDDKKLVQCAGLRHEVHNEAMPARKEVLDMVAGWILERRPPGDRQPA